MFSIASLRQLYQQMEWADALVWSAVMASDAASAEPAMLDKLRHLHGTQQYFLKVWLGQELTYDKSDTTLEDELALAHSWHEEARAFLGALDDEALSRELSLPWADRFAKRAGAEHANMTRLGETLYQVVAHSTYHRGQANTLLRQAGVTPPLTDFIAWLWLGTPEPRWP